eukprot:3933050-Rhodomonas_salina.1
MARLGAPMPRLSGVGRCSELHFPEPQARMCVCVISQREPAVPLELTAHMLVLSSLLLISSQNVYL